MIEQATETTPLLSDQSSDQKQSAAQAFCFAANITSKVGVFFNGLANSIKLELTTAPVPAIFGAVPPVGMK